MSARRAALRGVAWAALACALLATALSLGAHESARGEWLAMRAELERGAETYDPALSDARYLEVELWRDRSGYAGLALAFTLLLASALSAPPRAEAEPSASDLLLRDARLTRLLLASVIDGATMVALGACARLGSAAPSSLAMRDAAGPALVATIVALTIAATARGASAGRLAAGLGRGSAPGLGLALRAASWTLLATPLLLVASPLLALSLALGRAPSARWLAPHLAALRVAR